MIHYILQTIAFQLLFLLAYDLFLKKETFFKWNRIYLLATPIVSLMLPWIKIDFIRQNIPQEYIIQLPQVFLEGTTKQTPLFTETLDAIAITATKSMDLFEVIQYIWILGALVTLFIFGLKLYRIFTLKRAGTKTIIDGHRVVLLPNTDAAYSFFNSVFLGEDLSDTQKSHILIHEKMHINQRHSIDLLFFEILRILFWFNPLVYVFQKKMILLQEFAADAKAAAANGKKAYYQSLLSQVFKTESISFINTFFNHSLIQKRIVMLQKSKSKKIFQLKYLVILPVLCCMLVYTACSDSKDLETETTNTLAENSEVMTKINELSEAIMKKGNLTPEEEKALKFLATPAESGDKVYESVDSFMEDTKDDIAFAKIERVPTYPGCKGDNETLKKCMSQKIMTLVGNEFNTKLGKEVNLSGRQRITVQFKIDKTGKVTNVRARAPHENLEAEAIRVVNKIPVMKPGEHNGKTVSVLYSLPILFEIKE